LTSKRGIDRFAIDLSAPIPSPIALKPDKSYPSKISEQQYDVERVTARRPYLHGKGKDKFEYQVEWKSVKGGVEFDQDEIWYPGANLNAVSIRAYETLNPSRIHKPPSSDFAKPRRKDHRYPTRIKGAMTYSISHRYRSHRKRSNQIQPYRSRFLWAYPSILQTH
jgi:hypothetical protein